MRYSTNIGKAYKPTFFFSLENHSSCEPQRKSCRQSLSVIEKDVMANTSTLETK